METESPIDASGRTCRLEIELVDIGTTKSLPGLISNLQSGKAVRLSELIRRENNWYAMPKK